MRIARNTNSMGSGGRPTTDLPVVRFPPFVWRLDDYGGYCFHKVWKQRFVFRFE